MLYRHKQTHVIQPGVAEGLDCDQGQTITAPKQSYGWLGSRGENHFDILTLLLLLLLLPSKPIIIII